MVFNVPRKILENFQDFERKGVMLTDLAMENVLG